MVRYQHGVASYGVPLFGQLGIGNVYHVVQTASAFYSQFVKDKKTFYSDGSCNIHNTITSAIAATATERNDYIIVYPDATDYDEGATLTIANTSVHLLCPAGIGPSRGCIRAATIDPNSAAHAITNTGRGVEIGGFWIRGYTEKGCITSTGLGTFIHHNDCAVTCTTALAFGITIGAAGMQSIVQGNFIFSNAGAGTWLHGIDVSPSATRTKILNNEIIVANASTLTVGIDTTTLGTVMGGSMISVHDNVILEAPAVSGTGASTLSAGIRTGDQVFCTNNFVGITVTANAFIGGTANETLVQNFLSTSGGKLAV